MHRAGRGQEALLKGREGLRGPLGGPGRVGRAPRKAGKGWEFVKEGREEWEARQEIREGSGGFPGELEGWGCTLRGLRGVGRPFQRAEMGWEDHKRSGVPPRWPGGVESHCCRARR